MRRISIGGLSVLSVLAGAFLFGGTGVARAQQSCSRVTEVASGLDAPLGIARSPLGNLVVTESGAGTNNGRISIVSPAGETRLLVSGLPSGRNDVGGISGPAGVFMRGRTLYVAIGIGDTIKAGSIPGTAEPNEPPSSPIFSSVLAIHFSASVEKSTGGFAMSLADQFALAGGQRVTLSNGGGDTVAIDLVANFPDYVDRPGFPPPVVRGSNPFDLVVAADHAYVTDGGRNLLFKVELATGAFSELAEFPNIPNPFFNPAPPPPSVGPPTTEAVPTGIAYEKGELLVNLFRGAPFPPGTSIVESVNSVTGAHAAFIGGLKTAIDVLPVNSRPGTEYLVLQYASGQGPFFGGPGLVLRYPSPGASPELITDCLEFPTSMALDQKSGTLYVTEEGVGAGQGRVVAVSVEP